jgi:hypothetical protein
MSKMTKNRRKDLSKKKRKKKKNSTGTCPVTTPGWEARAQCSSETRKKKNKKKWSKFATHPEEDRISNSADLNALIVI